MAGDVVEGGAGMVAANAGGAEAAPLAPAAAEGADAKAVEAGAAESDPGVNFSLGNGGALRAISDWSSAFETSLASPRHMAPGRHEAILPAPVPRHPPRATTAARVMIANGMS
jgi:hypothetical protein